MIAWRRWTMSACGGQVGFGEERVVAPDREQRVGVAGVFAVFDAGLLIDVPNAPVFILVATGGAAFFFLLGALLRSEGEQRVRADRFVDELEASREAETAAAAVTERARLAREMHDVLAHALSAGGPALRCDIGGLECVEDFEQGRLVQGHRVCLSGFLGGFTQSLAR
jgi:hypothetical protein